LGLRIKEPTLESLMDPAGDWLPSEAGELGWLTLIFLDERDRYPGVDAPVGLSLPTPPPKYSLATKLMSTGAARNVATS